MLMMLNYELDVLYSYLRECQESNKFVVVYIDEENEIEFMSFPTLQEAREKQEELERNRKLKCGVIKEVKSIQHFLNMFDFFTKEKECRS